jgi:transcriptional regulator with XRE-family HTH domain
MAEKSIKVGERVKGLRMRRGWTCAEVAERSGIARQTIEHIESHLLSPPLGTLVSLASLFEVSVGELFGEAGDSSFCIVRSGDRQPAVRFANVGETSAYSYESLGQHKKKRFMEPFLVTLDPSTSRQVEPNQHIGEEFLFVLEGKVAITLLDRCEILEPGDSIYYDSTMPHIVACVGDRPATILAVIYAKEEMIIL